MRRTLLGILVALAALTTDAHAVPAQEFEPRTYAVTPVGLNFIGVGYGFASGADFDAITVGYQFSWGGG